MPQIYQSDKREFAKWLDLGDNVAIKEDFMKSQTLVGKRHQALLRVAQWKLWGKTGTSPFYGERLAFRDYY